MGTQQATQRTRPHCSPAGKCPCRAPDTGTCHCTSEQTSLRSHVFYSGRLETTPAHGAPCPQKAAQQPCSEPRGSSTQRTALRKSRVEERTESHRGRGMKVLDAPATRRPAPLSTSRHASSPPTCRDHAPMDHWRRLHPWPTRPRFLRLCWPPSPWRLDGCVCAHVCMLILT